MPMQRATDPRHLLLNLAPTKRGLRKTLTSLIRHQRTEIIAAIFVAIILLGYCAPVAAELTKSAAMQRQVSQRLLRNARTNFAQDDSATDLRCKSCQLYRQLTSLVDVMTPTSPGASRLLRVQLNRAARACGSLTYEKYRQLCRQEKPQDKVTSPSSDGAVMSLTKRLLSRKRRLASDGDVRRRKLSSNTGFYLEILPSGAVRGTTSQNTPYSKSTVFFVT